MRKELRFPFWSIVCAFHNMRMYLAHMHDCAHPSPSLSFSSKPTVNVFQSPACSVIYKTAWRDPSYKIKIIYLTKTSLKRLVVVIH